MKKSMEGDSADKKEYGKKTRQKYYVFGKNLRTAREARDLSQAELAKELGISQSQLCAYEMNSTEPSIWMLVRLAQQLNVRLESLLGIHQTDDALDLASSPKTSESYRDAASRVPGLSDAGQ